MLAKAKLKAAALTAAETLAKFESLTAGLGSTGGFYGHGSGSGGGDLKASPRSPAGGASVLGASVLPGGSSASLASGSGTAPGATTAGAAASTLSLLGIVQGWEQRAQVVACLRGQTSDHGSALRWRHPQKKKRGGGE